MIRTKLPVKKEPEAVAVAEEINDVMLAESGNTVVRLRITVGLIEEMEQLLEDNNFVDTACSIVGISGYTFYNWMKKGNKLLVKLEQGASIDDFDRKDRLYATFAFRIRQAMAKAQSSLVGNVNTAAKGDWKAAMALLEKVHKSKFGKEVNIKKDVTEKKSVSVSFNIPDNGRLMVKPKVSDDADDIDFQEVI